MKKRTLITFLSLALAGCLFCFSACDTDIDIDITTINEEETTLEDEMEEHNLIMAVLTLHGILYDANGNFLSNETVTFYDDDAVVFSGTTDADGILETCSLPSNTELYCTVTDSSGTLLGESNLIIKISDEYTNLIIYPADDEDAGLGLAECTVEIPVSKTEVRGALFVTNGGAVSFSSLTPYEETEVYEEESTEDGETEEGETEETEPTEETTTETEETTEG